MSADRDDGEMYGNLGEWKRLYARLDRLEEQMIYGVIGVVAFVAGAAAGFYARCLLPDSFGGK